MNKDILKRIGELRVLSEHLTTSDLQGIIGAIALNINKKYVFEIEEILLSYAYKDIDLKTAISQINFYELEVLKC